MAGLPEALVSYLSGHLQIVSRAQLVSMGFSRGEIHGWVRRGHLVSLERGVYGLPAAPSSFEHRVYARVLRCGDDAIAGPFATLALLGVEGFKTCRTIDVAVGSDRELRVSGWRHVAVPEIDRAQHGNVIPVMSAARALLEVAPHVSHKQLRVAFDDARRRNLLTVAHLSRRAAELSDHPGSPIVLAFLGSDAARAESEGERLFQPFLREVLPHENLEWQVADLVKGRRLDAAVRRVLLGIEYDSREFHVDREQDYLRDLDTGAEGVHIIRITVGMIRHHREATGAGIRAVVLQRERQLSSGTRGG